jgi:hypothetical protein
LTVDPVHRGVASGDPFISAGRDRGDEPDQESRVHVCNEGWVSVGCIGDDGEEHEVLYSCQRCEEEGEER